MVEKLQVEFLKPFFAAFAGAFFAFLFLRLAEMLKHFYDRKVKHYNALIKLEYKGNGLLDAIGRNQYQIDQIIQSFEAGQKMGAITIPANRPLSFEFDDAVMYDLANIEMINEVLSYSVEVKRFNSDIAGILSVYDLFKTALLQGTLSQEDYLRNYELYVSKFKELRAYLDNFETKTKRLMAMSVVRARKDKPLFTRLITLCMKTRHEKSFEKAVSAQLEQLEKDIEMVTKRSQQQIEEVRKKTEKTEQPT